MVALAIDLVSSMTFGPPSSFAFGEQAVTFLLAYLGIVPAFLIALTSFAVSALTAVGSPSLFLLHRRYSLTRWEIPFWVLHGRTNRFHRALVLSLGLVASLLLLATGRQLGWSGNYPPTLLYVVFLVALVLVSTVVLLYWLIALRRPSEVVRETRLMGEDVIGEVIDSTEVGGLSRPIDWRGTTSPYRCRYQEQEDLKRCLYALSDFAVRMLLDGQRFTAREATAAVVTLFRKVMARRASLPPLWNILWDRSGRSEEPTPDWFYRLIAESLESILLAAISHRRNSACSPFVHDRGGFDRMVRAATWRERALDRNGPYCASDWKQLLGDSSFCAP